MTLAVVLSCMRGWKMMSRRKLTSGGGQVTTNYPQQLSYVGICENVHFRAIIAPCARTHNDCNAICIKRLAIVVVACYCSSLLSPSPSVPHVWLSILGTDVMARLKLTLVMLFTNLTSLWVLFVYPLYVPSSNSTNPRIYAT